MSNELHEETQLDDLYMALNDEIFDHNMEIEQDLDNILSEVCFNSNFSCDLCCKVYKTKYGLKRHKTSKHEQINSLNEEKDSIQFSYLDLERIVGECAYKLSNDLCLPEEIRIKFSKQNFCFSSEDSISLFEKFQCFISKYNGDAEKFYSQFYGLLYKNLLPSKFENVLLTNTLLTEVGNHILRDLSGSKRNNLSNSEVLSSYVFSDKELSIIQYLAGYVVQKLYSKFKFYKSDEQYKKQCIEILSACKIDSHDTQKYVNTKNRGGLIKTNIYTQNIFIQCETIFRKQSKSFVTSINNKALVNEMLKDSVIISNLNNIRYNTEVQIDKEISFSLLESMLVLFTRVRSFSYARDIREKHQINKRQARKSSIRTEIKKATCSNVVDP